MNLFDDRTNIYRLLMKSSKMGDADGIMGMYQEDHSAVTVKSTCVSLKHYLLYMKEKKSIRDEADKVTADTVNRWMFSLRKAVATQRITVLEQTPRTWIGTGKQ